MMARNRPLVLGLGGSLRPRSASLCALGFALACAQRSGADTTLLTVKELDLPLYDDGIDRSLYPSGVHKLLAEVRRADALIVSSPVYHGTMSGAVKNLLDFLELLAGDDPPWLEEKTVGLITVSGGRPRADAIVSLEIACRALHAWTAPLSVSISEDAFEGGSLDDELIKRRLERLATTVMRGADHPPSLRFDRQPRRSSGPPLVSDLAPGMSLPAPAQE